MSKEEHTEDGSATIVLKNVSYTIWGGREEKLPYYLGISVELPRECVPLLGTYVRLTGEGKPFSVATNPGEFDYQKYKLGVGEIVSLTGGDIKAVRPEHNLFTEGLYQIKIRLEESLEQIFPEKEAGILKAMLLADKKAMDSEVKELYQDGGISHILAISGLHITIIGLGLYKILNRLTVSNVIAVPVSIFFIVSYVLLCGASPSGVRAGMLLCFSLLGKLFLKNYDLPTTLSCSAVCLVIRNPYVFYYSGMWLSYFAILGITFFLPLFLEPLKESSMAPKRRELLSQVVSGALISLFTLPLVLFIFYTYPPYSILLNLMIIPLMSFLLPDAILAMVVGLRFVTLGKVIGYPVRLLLSLYEFLIKISMNIPGSRWTLGAPTLWKIVLFYGVVFFLYYFRKRIRLLPKLLIPGILLCIVCFSSRNSFLITFLDVGQGDGICIEAGHNVIMIDGGSTSKGKLATYQMIPFLDYKGISHIDAWIITHPDLDHTSALVSILTEEWDKNDFRIDQIVLPKDERIREEGAELIALIESREIPIHYMEAGERFSFGKASFTCMNPFTDSYYEDINAASVVLYLSYGDFEALFTGDIDDKTEAQILRKVPEAYLADIDLLKVAHHGSKYASSEDFLERLHPEVSVISVGRNRYGHPTKETLSRLQDVGAGIYRTDEGGAVMIQVKRGKIEAREFRKETLALW